MSIDFFQFISWGGGGISRSGTLKLPSHAGGTRGNPPPILTVFWDFQSQPSFSVQGSHVSYNLKSNLEVRQKAPRTPIYLSWMIKLGVDVKKTKTKTKKSLPHTVLKSRSTALQGKQRKTRFVYKWVKFKSVRVMHGWNSWSWFNPFSEMTRDWMEHS